MNPLQRHAILQSRTLAATLKRQNESRRIISTAELVGMVQSSNGQPGPVVNNEPTMQHTSQSHSGLADIAICVGGGNDPMAEYAAALALCRAAGKSVATFVCNDMLSCFPDVIDHACTLHPDKWQYWRAIRERSNLPHPKRLWAHRSYPGFSDHTKDWQGSSGLFLIKVARELGYTHIILCGIPMSEEGDHFTRRQRWHAAAGFRRGWARVQGALRPFVRSMSGWTKEHFTEPTDEWIRSTIPDQFPMKVDHSGVRA